MAPNTDENIAKLIEGIKIPPAPFVLQKLQRELQKDEPLLADVANILAQDVGLSALVLRSVNSPFFGLRAKAKSIQHATSLLGLRNTVNIVAGLALRRTFEESGHVNPPNYWDSPTNVAMVAAGISQALNLKIADEAYMLGLFHNAGHALMIQRFANYRDFLLKYLNHEQYSLIFAEDHRYNTNHTVLGYFLARSWGLDKKIANVIRDHHHAEERLRSASYGEEEELTLLSILKIAEHVDKLFWGYSPDYEWESIQEAVLGYLGLSELDFRDLRDDMSDKLISGAT